MKSYLPYGSPYIDVHWSFLSFHSQSDVITQRLSHEGSIKSTHPAGHANRGQSKLESLKSRLVQARIPISQSPARAEDGWAAGSEYGVVCQTSSTYTFCTYIAVVSQQLHALEVVSVVIQTRNLANKTRSAALAWSAAHEVGRSAFSSSRRVWDHGS